jgi:hypothetical protein
VTLTKRERERVQQHTAPGHALVEGIPNTHTISTINSYTPGTVRLYQCSCGWSGWLPPGLVK